MVDFPDDIRIEILLGKFGLEEYTEVVSTPKNLQISASKKIPKN